MDQWTHAEVLLGKYEPNRVAPEGHAEVFLQWKGTDACFDFWCECGAQSHFDGLFAYQLKCGSCGALFAMPFTIYPVRITEPLPTAGPVLMPRECAGCSETDDTVADRPVQKGYTAPLCARCGKDPGVLRGLAEAP